MHFTRPENRIDYAYFNLMDKIVIEGASHDDRTGVGTASLFGESITWNPPASIAPNQFALPVIQGKRTNLKSILVELLWFLSGQSNIKYLKDNNVSIWDEWADENGDLGPVYGIQWRAMPIPEEYQVNGKKKLDQIWELANNLITNPNSRRHMLVTYNPPAVPHQALPPCHVMAQFSVRPGTNNLDMILTQRSADLFLGVPFNMVSYCLLQAILCMHTGYKIGKAVFNFGDVHIYKNHFNQVTQYHKQYLRLIKIDREVYGESKVKIPYVEITPTLKSPSIITQYEENLAPSNLNGIGLLLSDFVFRDNDSMEFIKAPVAV